MTKALAVKLGGVRDQLRQEEGEGGSSFCSFLAGCCTMYFWFITNQLTLDWIKTREGVLRAMVCLVLGRSTPETKGFTVLKASGKRQFPMSAFQGRNCPQGREGSVSVAKWWEPRRVLDSLCRARSSRVCSSVSSPRGDLLSNTSVPLLCPCTFGPASGNTIKRRGLGW